MSLEVFKDRAGEPQKVNYLSKDGTYEVAYPGYRKWFAHTLTVEDAYLVSAAPEMYEALQSALPHLLDDTQQPMADGIRLVLAKAEGGAR